MEIENNSPHQENLHILDLAWRSLSSHWQTLVHKAKLKSIKIETAEKVKDLYRCKEKDWMYVNRSRLEPDKILSGLIKPWFTYEIVCTDIFDPNILIVDGLEELVLKRNFLMAIANIAAASDHGILSFLRGDRVVKLHNDSKARKFLTRFFPAFCLEQERFYERRRQAYGLMMNLDVELDMKVSPVPLDGTE